MCLILLALDQHPDFPLVMAANRDEFHARPTRAIQWWEDQPLLAGKDLESGGTWLGITPDGRIAAVTNYRSGRMEPAPRSRGELPLRALEAAGRGPSLLKEIDAERSQFGGFNLMFCDGSGWFYTGNRDSVTWRRLYRGVFGLSNHLLQTAWPKVVRGREAMGRALAGHRNTASLHDALLTLLRDDRQAPIADLPDTGVGRETELFLSPPFIRGENYGTRASTIITRDRGGNMTVTEVSFGTHGEPDQTRRLQWQASPVSAGAGL